MLIRSFFAMQQVDTGFNADNVLTAGLPISEKRFHDSRSVESVYLRQVVSNVESLPGVRDVALTSALPMQGWGYGMPFQIAGKPDGGSGEPEGVLLQDGEPVVLRRHSA